MQGEVPEEDVASFTSEIDTTPNGGVIDGLAARRMSNVQRALSASQANIEVAAAITMATSSELDLHQLEETTNLPANATQAKDPDRTTTAPNESDGGGASTTTAGYAKVAVGLDSTDGGLPTLNNAAITNTNDSEQGLIFANPARKASIDLGNEHQVQRITSTFEPGRASSRDTGGLTFTNATYEEEEETSASKSQFKPDRETHASAAGQSASKANTLGRPVPDGKTATDLNTTSSALFSQIDEVLADLNTGLDQFTGDVVLG